jgi:hypothetical protein
MSVKGTPGGQFRQLQLFVDPEQHIADLGGSNDGANKETLPSLLDQKLAQSRLPAGSGHGSGLYDDIKERGVQERIIAYEHWKAGGKLIQGEGHHRLASAAAAQQETGRPQFVPIEYVPFDVRKYQR